MRFRWYSALAEFASHLLLFIASFADHHWMLAGHAVALLAFILRWLGRRKD